MADETTPGTFDDIFQITDEPTDEPEEHAIFGSEEEEQDTALDTPLDEDDDEEPDDEEEDSEEDSEENDSDDEDEEDDEETDDDSEEPEKDKPADKPAEKAPQTFTVKVNGEERVVDEAELVRGYQTQAAATQKFQEAKNLTAAATSFYNAVIENPGKALVTLVSKKFTNGDSAQAREVVKNAFLDFLKPDIEEANITDPKEREIYRLKRQANESAEERADRERQEAADAEKAKEEAFLNQTKTSVQNQLKIQSLPDLPEVKYRAGQILQTYLDAGVSREQLGDLIPAAVKAVADERAEQAKALSTALSPDEFAKKFPEHVKALKKDRVDRVKKKKRERRKKKTTSSRRRSPARDRTISTDEAFGRRF